MDLVSLIVVLAVIVLAQWAFGRPTSITVVLHTLLVAILVLYLLRWVGLVAGGPLRIP